MNLSLLFNNFTFIVIEITLGSILAFFGILTYGKTRKISYLFFVISSFFIYLSMIFKVLAELNIFTLSEYSYNNVAVLNYAIDFPIYIFMIIGFILLIKEK